jgi:2-methylcitrate dehydratase PrpD
MTKPLHAGRAAQSGVIAARLAAQGFTAAEDVLEHRNGFLKAHSPSGTPRLDDGVMDLGLKWRLAERGMDIKRYPTCYATHRCIDAMLELVLNYDVTPRDVSHIDVHTGKNQLLVLRNHNPSNALEAKFSMQFAMAAALVARRVGLAQLTDEFVGRPEVGANMQKVRCSTTIESMVGDELFAPDDRVSVRLVSGRVLEHAPVTHAKGSWHNPLTSAELEEKFSACASAALSREEWSTLHEQLSHLDSINSIRDLQLIGAGGRQHGWS